MKNKIIWLVILTFITVTCSIVYICNNLRQDKMKVEQRLQKKQLLNDIKDRYSRNVITIKRAKLYIKDGETFINKGFVSQNKNLVLESIQNITEHNKYFKIDALPYYIFYEDVVLNKDIQEINQDYKNYIPFNENVVTVSDPTVYDRNDNLIF